MVFLVFPFTHCNKKRPYKGPFLALKRLNYLQVLNVDGVTGGYNFQVKHNINIQLLRADKVYLIAPLVMEPFPKSTVISQFVEFCTVISQFVAIVSTSWWVALIRSAFDIATACRCFMHFALQEGWSLFLSFLFFFLWSC